VDARLTDGTEIYPHRRDLASLPFWRCDTCRNFVGCHHKTADRTKPLGCIPTKEIKNARQHIHSILDPLWKGKKNMRGKVYRKVAAKLGIEEYHTAELRTIEDARQAYKAVLEIRQEMG
jgi:2-hydroxychromene-2-carboxylate isomerase